MQLISDSGAVFTLHTNLGGLIEEMETKSKTVATLVDSIVETTWKDGQGKKFYDNFKDDMQILTKLHDDMAEKQKAIKDLGDALKKYEEE